eukprot:TRINITY_DN1039_c0_g1_i1.p1 TRINITY_DN1039_c0_g1~~TRINITY_DN1039_c0_g1_i1.p1  ORF type:complete len:473 (-),score=87.70 TRINITY_DN1039_c0_g1_i1:1086-2504(-)
MPTPTLASTAQPMQLSSQKWMTCVAGEVFQMGFLLQGRILAPQPKECEMRSNPSRIAMTVHDASRPVAHTHTNLQSLLESSFPKLEKPGKETPIFANTTAPPPFPFMGGEESAAKTLTSPTWSGGTSCWIREEMEVTERVHQICEMLICNEWKILHLDFGTLFPVFLQSDELLAINEVIKYNRHLRTLMFCSPQPRAQGVLRCAFLDDGVFFSALQHNTTLQSLHLELCQLSDSKLELLLGILLKRKGVPINLNISGKNQFRSLNSLSNALNDGLNVMELNLSRNSCVNLPLRDWTLFAQAAVMNNLQIQSLVLDKANVNDEAALELAKALHKNHSLTHLDLVRNQLGDRAGIGLFKMLETNTGLTLLRLTRNQFTSASLVPFPQALSKNCTLASLNLEHNQIDDGGALLISHGLMENKSLCTIKLGNNHITASGVQEIFKTLPNSGVKDLRLLWFKQRGTGDLAHLRLGKY